jgi:hypothetical protein
LCFLMAGAIAAAPVPSRLGNLSQVALVAMLVVTSIYFLMCLRLTYFREWKYGSEREFVRVVD